MYGPRGQGAAAPPPPFQKKQNWATYIFWVGRKLLEKFACVCACSLFSIVLFFFEQRYFIFKVSVVKQVKFRRDSESDEFLVIIRGSYSDIHVHICNCVIVGHCITPAASWIRPSVGGLGPYSRPLAQFFSTRTSRPANNIYIFSNRETCEWPASPHPVRPLHDFLLRLVSYGSICEIRHSTYS